MIKEKMNYESLELTPEEQKYINGEISEMSYAQECGRNDFTEQTGRGLDKEYIQPKVEGGNKMASLKEEAMAFTPQLTKNIADLDQVSVDLVLEDREGTDKQGEIFKYKVIVVDKEDYRVPGKVLGDLKSILEKKPTLRTFSVSKKGTGLNTQYTVIPME